MIRHHLPHIVVLVALLLIPGWVSSAQSHQSLSQSRAIGATETFSYDLRFKFGIVQGKVGQAVLTNNPIATSKQYLSQVVFRTTGVGNLVFPTRDTLETLYSPAALPIRYEKRGVEKNNVTKDEVRFDRLASQVRARVHAVWGPYTKGDTTYTIASSGPIILDLVSTLALVRSVDTETDLQQLSLPFQLPQNEHIVQGRLTYERDDTAKMPDGTEHAVVVLAMHIKDKAFNTENKSVELYVTKDQRRIPVIVRAKLQLGYVECQLREFSTTLQE